MTDRPILKPGDRFEMTVRGEVTEVSSTGEIAAKLDGAILARTVFTPIELAAAKITILEPELKVGRVRLITGYTGRIVALYGEKAWVVLDNETNNPLTIHAANLRNIPEDQS